MWIIHTFLFFKFMHRRKEFHPVTEIIKKQLFLLNSRSKFKVILFLQMFLEPQKIRFSWSPDPWSWKSVSESFLCALNRFRRQEYLAKCNVFFSLNLIQQIRVLDEINLPLVSKEFWHVPRITPVSLMS